MTASTCRTCGTDLTPLGRGRVVEHGTVRGVLEGAAAWSCPNGHGTRTADAAAARDEVHTVLDIAERTRVRSTLRCAVCHTPYVLPGRRVTRSVTLTTTGLPVTTLTLDIPMLRCTEDAVESMPPECLQDLDTVITELLEEPT